MIMTGAASPFFFLAAIATMIVLILTFMYPSMNSGTVAAASVSSNKHQRQLLQQQSQKMATATTMATTMATATATATKNPQAQGQGIRRPPNFVIILTDDLDWTLGGANSSTLKQTRFWIGGGEGGRGGGGGKTFTNWFVQTPVCCASRAELLTGKVYHNLKVNAFNASHDGCMHIDVEDDPQHPFWDKNYFSNYFSSGASATDSNITDSDTTTTTTTNPACNRTLNYSIGIFGKHLNSNNPTNFVPNGVNEMLINGGGEYLNPTFTHGTRRRRRKRTRIAGHHELEIDEYYKTTIKQVTFDNCTESTGMPCYSTSVIGNASLSWIKRQVAGDSHEECSTTSKTPNCTDEENDKDYNPFFALISVKAPHLQDGNGFPMAIPAPWYANASIPESKAPRTPNYNVTNPQYHWLVRNQPPLTKLQAAKVDELYVSRLKTLLSVDDLVQDLMETLTQIGVLDDTYVLFTSDNGYRLGQFQMPQCKLHPYENDVRVPMMIRGPGIVNTSSRNIDNSRSLSANNNDRALFSHIHIMPTLLGLATGQHNSQDIIPKTMDGTNLASWILDQKIDQDIEGTGSCNSNSREITAFGHSNSMTETAPLTSTEPFSVLSPSLSASLLIEYTSLGNVIRYQHLVDTYNHSFVALRIMPRATVLAIGTSPNQLPANQSTQINSIRKDPRRWVQAKEKHSRGSNLQAFLLADETIVTSGHYSAVASPIDHISNLKYIEFRDSRIDWTNTRTVPLERELYDLDSDPYELHNLIHKASPLLLKALAVKTKRLMECSGSSCRNEHSTGLHSKDHDDDEELRVSSTLPSGNDNSNTS